MVLSPDKALVELVRQVLGDVAVVRAVDESELRNPARIQSATALVIHASSDGAVLRLLESFSRRGGGPAILVCLESTDQQAVVAALESGADQVIGLPPDAREMRARLVSMLRPWLLAGSLQGRIVFRDIEIDLMQHRVERAGTYIDLTPKECAVLAFLANRAGEIISVRTLATEVWHHFASQDSDTYRKTLSSLCKKLLPLTDRALIENIWGEGYRLNAD